MKAKRQRKPTKPAAPPADRRATLRHALAQFDFLERHMETSPEDMRALARELDVPPLMLIIAFYANCAPCMVTLADVDELDCGAGSPRGAHRVDHGARQGGGVMALRDLTPERADEIETYWKQLCALKARFCTIFDETDDERARRLARELAIDGELTEIPATHRLAVARQLIIALYQGGFLDIGIDEAQEQWRLIATRWGCRTSRCTTRPKRPGTAAISTRSDIDEWLEGTRARAGASAERRCVMPTVRLRPGDKPTLAGIPQSREALQEWVATVVMELLDDPKGQAVFAKGLERAGWTCTPPAVKAGRTKKGRK